VRDVRGQTRGRMEMPWWLRPGKEEFRCKDETSAGGRCKAYASVKGHCMVHARKRRLVKVCLTCGGEHPPEGPHVRFGRERS
jgi:hypothetical protein